VSDALVKVYAPGYLLVLDLHARVDDAAARARVAADEVCITLPKARAARGDAGAVSAAAWFML
jgi:hypothetical protein